MRTSLLLLSLCLAGPAHADKMTHTYSIVAVDPEAGEIGAAVQSHWFGVASMVAWAEPGVGAVATQALTNRSFGPRGLQLLKSGLPSKQVLQLLLAADKQADDRQVAIIDRKGNTAVWTGKNNIPHAGHKTGKYYSVQANIMRGGGVWSAMSQAFEDAKGPLAERMVAALEAAQLAGGDLRGAQSAGLIVVRAKASDEPWEDRLIDLRVEDHPTPVVELKRLLQLKRAYEAYDAGEEALSSGKEKKAEEYFERAHRLAYHNMELRFWEALARYKNGQEEKAALQFRRLFLADPAWKELFSRLPRAGLLTEEQVTEVLGE